MSQKGDPKIAPTVPQSCRAIIVPPYRELSSLTVGWGRSQRERNQKFLRADERKTARASRT
jgi:hypothetical protein